MSLATPKCSMERIRTLRHAPSGGDVAVDTVTVINGLVTVAYADVDQNANGQFIYQADELEVVKVDGVAVTEGDPAYYDSDQDEFTPTPNANTTPCGRFIYDAASGDTTAYIELNGQFQVDANGGLTLPEVVSAGRIPTSDPSVAGQVWSNSGVLTVSAG